MAHLPSPLPLSGDTLAGLQDSDGHARFSDAPVRAHPSRPPASLTPFLLVGIFLPGPETQLRLIEAKGGNLLVWKPNWGQDGDARQQSLGRGSSVLCPKLHLGEDPRRPCSDCGPQPHTREGRAWSSQQQFSKSRRDLGTSLGREQEAPGRVRAGPGVTFHFSHWVQGRAGGRVALLVEE